MILLDDNAGYVQVQIGAAGIQLDLYEANNTYAALSALHEEDLVALGNAWASWLQGKGLPALSHGAAFRIADGVLDAVRAFKKNEGSPSAMPGSAASMASASTGAPAA